MVFRRSKIQEELQGNMLLYLYLKLLFSLLCVRYWLIVYLCFDFSDDKDAKQETVPSVSYFTLVMLCLCYKSFYYWPKSGYLAGL